MNHTNSCCVTHSIYTVQPWLALSLLVMHVRCFQERNIYDGIWQSYSLLAVSVIVIHTCTCSIERYIKTLVGLYLSHMAVATKNWNSTSLETLEWNQYLLQVWRMKAPKSQKMISRVGCDVYQLLGWPPNMNITRKMIIIIGWDEPLLMASAVLLSFCLYITIKGYHHSIALSM